MLLTEYLGLRSCFSGVATKAQDPFLAAVLHDCFGQSIQWAESTENGPRGNAEKSTKAPGESHRREHPFGDTGQILFFCLFAATWIADTFFFKYTTLLDGHIPLVARLPLAVLLLIGSGYLAKKGAGDRVRRKGRKTCCDQEERIRDSPPPDLSERNSLLPGFPGAEPFIGCHGGMGRCGCLSAFVRIS